MSLLTSMVIATVSMSILFTSISHPLAMGAILLTQTIIIAMMTTLTIYTSWFSYILFLIFLGAILVLFIYVASLAPNEPFNISPPMVALLIASLLVAILVSVLDPLLLMYSVTVKPQITEMSMLPTSYTATCPMYEMPSLMMTLFLILYLLLTLVVIVKITTTHFGPLRLN
uniref:NADH-ubiquinone oxidoreductase chain 6 n=1 Tax=Typhlopatsa pauliani TaxID=2010953 RepID=A0A1Z2R747_9EUCA|nr:NADH dehydrogenase subunit 6 [Typhlopatsa pauliani]ASA39538.1 NADH dehydrogenase subunit 6 [Typhlopatsa pauliani]